MTSPELSVSVRSITAGRNDIPTKRLLRKYKTEEDDDEERVFGIKFGLVDDAIESFQSYMLLRSMQNSFTTTDEAFAKVGLKVDEVADLLESPKWKTWATYITTHAPSKPDEAIAAAMTLRYGGDGVAKILASAANSANTKALAVKLEAAQLTRCPQLATWNSYLKLYNKKYPRKETTTMIDAFKASYGDEELLKMIISAENAKNAGAVNMKDDLIKSWLNDPTHPANMFQNLKLDKSGDDFLTNPLLPTWVQYMNAFNKEYPHSATTMIQTFTKTYGEDKLATMLQAAAKVPGTEKVAENLQGAQFNLWMVQKKNPDDIFKLFKLESSTLATSSSADIWRAYYRAYEKQNPGTLFSFKP
ncbi:hypothetical protein BBJ29_009952 [Phytophthora kernoviae]|uniref:RxLR effector protein n=1 Tax=Phytophthora kernoviae TaxID=325452 RepID=A0A3F2RBD5_9STRA|nr:hypothetical protein BBP00_00009855 [Phytophthora kernoviae]RLN52284.1 hypothetical protein BBJ29_009952 [Phytophthora kernoviae]